MTDNNNIDTLIDDIVKYRQSDEFFKIMDFVGKFKHIAPFNAFLINIQRPSARLVLRAKEWKDKFNRRIHPNAQQLIVLVPFGPVEIMYDIDQTVAIDTPENLQPSLFDDITDIALKPKQLTEQQIIDSYIHQYQTENTIDKLYYYNLMDNMAKYGISIDNNFNASSEYAAYISVSTDETILIKYNKDGEIYTKSKYLISVNSQQDLTTSFASICHELGHLFCKHLPYYNEGMVRKRLSHKEKEFEAEAVAWLICRRMGIKNPSEKYLAGYVGTNEPLPQYSMEAILRATAEIEKMIQGPVSLSKTPFYKDNKELKDKIKTLKRK